MNIVEARNVTKRYTGHTALDDVTVEVPEGSVYGLLGPNGAGKSTLIRIINHITMPDAGQILFKGNPLQAGDIASIGYLPEERGLYKKMKVGEQAVFFARLKGMSRHDATVELKRWFDKWDMGQWWNRKVEDLSKGMAQKVQFIITVVHKPELLIFDEPFSGFDPINTNMLKEEILELHRQGATVIFSTHNMASVEELCNHIMLINKSRNILSGNVDEIRATRGGNRVRFVLSGAVDNMLPAALLEAGVESELSRGEGSLTNLIVTPTSEISSRHLITLVNDRAEIKSMEPLLPSMEQIFINTVKEYNSHE